MRLGFLCHTISFLPLILAQTTTSGKGCRCLYGQSCWPSEQDFTSLSSNLSQPLIRPVPPASPCYPIGNPSGNCSDVQLNWKDANWRANQPGAYQNANLETFINKNGSISACYVNTTLNVPCEQGSVPPIGVDARTADDVQAAVRFAARHNLRLVVKNTGHDYIGRSAGRGAFMIWTHHLKNITYEANFIPEGSSSNETTPALTIGAGVEWGEAYAAAGEHQRLVVLGLSDDLSVGAAGGWVMGGGHSLLSPKYGLGVDNALQFTIVNADGDHVIANAHRNPDLFWALRGGGGGSWGVVTSVTYRTYDLELLTAADITVTFPNPEVAQTVATEFLRLHPKLSDAGWGGYSFINNQSFLALFIAPNVSLAEMNATILPFFDFVLNVTGQPPDAVVSTSAFENFYTWINQTSGAGLGDTGAGGNAELASRFVSREAAEQRTEEAAQVLLGLDLVAINFSVGGGAVARVDPDSVALNPNWRKAVALAFTLAGWEEGDSSEVIHQTKQQVAQFVRHLEPISPDSATYMNEASFHELDFRKSFFGDHYNKLRSLKHKYDPKSLFLVPEGVGSEEWNSDLTCPR